jgi:hypothetical protein
MDDLRLALPDQIPDVKFNLKSQEQFINDHGVIFEHWAAIPSPIGLKDRGEYRRPDTLDTFSSNGFIYRKIGEFTGIITSNQKDMKAIEGGLYDSSMARLIMPKFYLDNGKEIKLLPGDRIYAKHIELKVDNYQRVNYNQERGIDLLQFPAKDVSLLLDSTNTEYVYGIDFKLDGEGNVQWIKRNPGIDPETGDGRVYSIRYTYLAFWYVYQLLNEIRITNETVNKTPERMPYHVIIQREYVYHNRANASKQNTVKNSDRKVSKPTENIEPDQFEVKVNIDDIE